MDTIDASLEQLKDLFKNMVATLRKEKEELHAAQKRFETVSYIHNAHILSLLAKQEKQLVAANNMKQSEVMKVDVGGSTFHVSRSVLVAEPDSLLDSLFSGRFRIDTQADGSVFIDRLKTNLYVLSISFLLQCHSDIGQMKEIPHFLPRDPEHFPRILTFLRDGVVDKVPPQAHPSLLREAHFFSLDPLVRELQVCEDVVGQEGSPSLQSLQLRQVSIRFTIPIL